ELVINLRTAKALGLLSVHFLDTSNTVSPLRSGEPSEENSFRAGQGELKYGAARFIGPCPQPAPVGIDDRPADRQPHPRSVGLGGVESPENALEMFLINAQPGIAHGHEGATRFG